MLGQPTSTFFTGQKKIAVTGTSVQLGTNVVLQNGVTVKASKNNTAAMYLGPSSSVANTGTGTGNGFELQPGDSVSMAITNLNSVYVNGAANDFCSYLAN